VPALDDYAWLDPVTVLAWLKIDPENEAAASRVETCRRAAANWCEDERSDLLSTDDPAEFAATDRVVMAGILATGRLVARTDSPVGIASFESLGAAPVLRTDPDVRALLGRRVEVA
jgi:hypothetical protein